jgi:hypothetical protein
VLFTLIGVAMAIINYNVFGREKDRERERVYPLDKAWPLDVL